MKIVEPIGSLSPIFLDGVIRKITPVRTFLKRLLFPETTIVELSKEFVQVDQIVEGLQVAPFVAVNGQPWTLERGTQSAQVIQTPHIAVDLPLQATDELLKRMAGESMEAIFNETPADQRLLASINKLIGEDVVRLDNSIQNREEWMVARMLEGGITYSTSEDGKDDFTVTMNKPAANTLTVATKWDDANLDDAKEALITTIDAAKKVVADNQGPILTDCILSEEADAALMKLVRSGKLKDLVETEVRMRTGTNLTLAEEWDDLQGVIYRGEILNIRFWHYNHELDGAKMIRPNYAEFVSRGGVSERRMYYGSIPDIKAVMDGLHITRRYSKTELKETYPSSLKQLMISRPLPVFRRPDWHVSAPVTTP